MNCDNKIDRVSFNVHSDGSGYEHPTGDGWGYAWGLGNGDGGGTETGSGFRSGNGYGNYPYILINY